MNSIDFESLTITVTVAGFAIHMVAKITSHTLRLLSRLQLGIDVQTFQSTAPC